jgi:hypothetical protein
MDSSGSKLGAVVRSYEQANDPSDCKSGEFLDQLSDY